MRWIIACALLALLALLGACAPSLDAPPPATASRSLCASGEPVLAVQMFFGRVARGRAPVSDAEWKDFADSVLTPNFPDGFTVLDGRGQWRNPDTAAIVAEDAKVLVIVAPRTLETRARLDAVASFYKERFNQLSVLTVTADACAAF
jgi:hypothetical protein